MSWIKKPTHYVWDRLIPRDHFSWANELHKELDKKYNVNCILMPHEEGAEDDGKWFELITYDLPSTLSILQQETITEVLDVDVQQVRSNGDHKRFYTESHESRWHGTHHLMDLEVKQAPGLASLRIIECANDAITKEVNLTFNEVDDLLNVLLTWRLAYADPPPTEHIQEIYTDDQPF